jgi:hypothetical protein
MNEGFITFGIVSKKHNWTQLYDSYLEDSV